MPLTIGQSILFFGIISITTFVTRVLPFIVFPDHKEMPKYVEYLGNVLPFTIIGMLVIYCLKDVSFIKQSFGLPEIISIGVITFLHLWKRNILLSIGGGTVLYMILVQVIFL
jgi:branched-subunit amino acid transport protein AzlD